MSVEPAPTQDHATRREYAAASMLRPSAAKSCPRRAHCTDCPLYAGRLGLSAQTNVRGVCATTGQRPILPLEFE